MKDGEIIMSIYIYICDPTDPRLYMSIWYGQYAV